MNIYLIGFIICIINCIIGFCVEYYNKTTYVNKDDENTNITWMAVLLRSLFIAVVGMIIITPFIAKFHRPSAISASSSDSSES